MISETREVRQQFSLCFKEKLIGGTPREDGTGTKAVEWVPVDKIAGLHIHPSMRLRIDHALDPARTEPYLG